MYSMLGFQVQHVAAARSGDGGLDVYATKGCDLDEMRPVDGFVDFRRWPETLCACRIAFGLPRLKGAIGKSSHRTQQGGPNHRGPGSD